MTQTFEMRRKDGLRIGGVVSGALTLPRAEAHKAILRGVGPLRDQAHLPPGTPLAFLPRLGPEFYGAGVCGVIPDLGVDTVTVMFAGRHNAFVNQGLQRMLNSGFVGPSAARISHIGLSADAQAVTASTTSLDPAGGATGVSIKTTANVALTAQTMHTDQTWTQAEVTWPVRKIGQLTSGTATDVTNIIGGAGGASPYNEDFTIDLTNIGLWSLLMGIDTTATAS